MQESETILETNRLILSLWTRADADDLFEILSDVEVARYVSDGKPYSFEKILDFLTWAERFQSENGFCRWKVIEKTCGKTIGSCGFTKLPETSEIELGFLFAQKYWGRGFATESAEASMLYGFQNLGFREIISLTDPKNTASHRVLEKIGFDERGFEHFKGEENLVFVKKKI